MMNRREFLQTSAAAVALPLRFTSGRGTRHWRPSTQALPPLPAPAADGWIDLFNGKNLDGFYTFLQRSGKDADPKGYVKVENGLLHIMGNEVTSEVVETGYIATYREFSDCRIRVEFKWGEKRFPNRLEAKRDNGLCYHIVGKDVVWPTWVECQIQESDCGDVFLLGNTKGGPGGLTTFNPGRGARGAGAAAPVGGQAGQGRGAAATGAGSTTPAPPPQVNTNPRVQGNRILKEGDFENRNDWNTIEVILQNDRSAHIVNGRIVNAVNNIQQPDPANPGQFIPLTRGKIAVQAEYAEIWYRRIAVKMLA
jgi:hypothetical protein